MKSKLYTVFAIISFLFFNYSIFAQKTSDLEFRIISPEPGASIQYGDTAEVTYLIKNLGPDDLSSEEEIYISNTLFPINQIQREDLVVGDSMSAVSITAWNSSENRDTFYACFYLNRNLHLGINDEIQTNDTSCITFYLEGCGPTQIEDISSQLISNLSIYPNPSSTSVNVSFEMNKTAAVEITITDILGRELYRQAIGKIDINQRHEMKIDIATLNPGIYFVEINGEGLRSVKKLHVR